MNACQVTFRSATAQERTAALALVWSDSDAADRDQRVELLKAEALRDPAAWEGLLIACRQGRLVGAVLVQIQTGKIGFISVPRLVAGESEASAVELLGEADRFAQQRGCLVGQTLLAEPLASDIRVLEAGGYQRITDLDYLVSVAAVFPAVQPHTPLQFEAQASESPTERLKAIVQQTYTESLDCPQLNGIRPVEDVLDSYRSSGGFDPSRWFIVCRGGEDVGCLLLADHAAQESWELVYMGLAPQARGHGWGVHIARRAQWLAFQAGRQRLVVAVDAANVPAIRMYRAAGFETWQRRTVFLRVFSRDCL